MNLKNYTTEVPASRSISYIEDLLVGFGAKNLLKDYDNGRCTGISFMIEMDGMKLPFKLPARVKEGFIWLKNKKPKSREKLLQEQAERMVWKQLHEWVFLQLCQIELSQMEKLEAFFPYLYDFQGKTTYYERIKNQKFVPLLSAPE